MAGGHQGKTLYAALQKQLRQSDYVHGDETGGRENGKSGRLWRFSTLTLCYFTYPKTCAGHVVTDICSDDRKERAAARVCFQEELTALASPLAATSLPQNTLCKRLLQFESERFPLVEHLQVPCENNAAERSVRRRVIARKISGGTRASAGSQTMCVLSNLFATWQLRGEEGLAASRKMLMEAQKAPGAAPARTPLQKDGTVAFGSG